MTRTVLVTGVSRHIGARVARTLASSPEIERVIGVDTVPPPRSSADDDGPPLGRTEFVRVDLRSPDIAQVISAADIDTVVHMSLVTHGDRARMKEHNVIGTMQLLAACQRSATIRRFVVRSTTAVYGSSSSDPAVFAESDEPHEIPHEGYAKDASEIERYVRGFARRRQDISLTVLRFVNFMGPGVNSPLTRYLEMPVLPSVLGFDPRLQFVHEDDGVEVLRRMAAEDHPGTYNVTGEGTLLLSQCVRRAGRVRVPVAGPLFGLMGEVAAAAGIRDFSPEQRQLMRHGRVVDGSRLAERLGWKPKYSTATAFDDFLQSRGLSSGFVEDVVDRVARVVRLRW